MLLFSAAKIRYLQKTSLPIMNGKYPICTFSTEKGCDLHRNHYLCNRNLPSSTVLSNSSTSTAASSTRLATTPIVCVSPNVTLALSSARPVVPPPKNGLTVLSSLRPRCSSATVIRPSLKFLKISTSQILPSSANTSSA